LVNGIRVELLALQSNVRKKIAEFPNNLEFKFMSVVTLLTDFGTKDYFVGALKGTLKQKLPEYTIIDLSHEVEPFNVVEAAYILRSSYTSFANETIHLIGLDAEWNSQNMPLYLPYKEQHFLAADNGLFSLVFPNVPMQSFYSLNPLIPSQKSSSDLAVLVDAAVCIQNKTPKNQWCQPAEQVKQVSELITNVIDERVIKGHVIYIDHYGNAVTSITKEQFDNQCKGRSFNIEFHRYKINRLVEKYSEVSQNEKFSLKDHEGDKLALFNEAGYLEIALYRSNPNTVGSAHSLLGLSYRDSIIIRFSEK